MTLYARIDTGKVAELFETDGDMVSMFHPAMVWVEVTAEAARIGDHASALEGIWSFATPVPDTSALWIAYQATAQAAIDKSDATMLRCAENSVAVPAAWACYRKALRAIVGAASGDPTKPLPTRPSYPAGT